MIKQNFEVVKQLKPKSAGNKVNQITTAKNSIKKQLGFDIAKYETDVFGKKRKGFYIDKKSMSINDYQELKSFALKTQKGYGEQILQIHDNGSWCDFIEVKKRC